MTTKGDKGKIEVFCPRCKESIGTLLAWIETEYEATFDEGGGGDVGKVAVEVKIAERGSAHATYAGSTIRMDHNCERIASATPDDS